MQRCPSTPMRYASRELHEEARDVARALAKTGAFGSAIFGLDQGYSVSQTFSKAS